MAASTACSLGRRGYFSRTSKTTVLLRVFLLFFGVLVVSGKIKIQTHKCSYVAAPATNSNKCFPFLVVDQIVQGFQKARVVGRSRCI